MRRRPPGDLQPRAFAFQSGAMTNMTDYLANAAKAVENGLNRDEALRALTLRPAEILGVADRLGTIETGKIANLTITRGDLFDRKSTIAQVFIDGRPVELKPVTPTPANASGTATGTWALNVNIGEGDVTVTLALQQEGERVSGSMEGELGTGKITNASVGAAGDIRFTVPLTFSGQTTEAVFAGTITGNEMRGTVQIVGRGAGSFNGTRTGSTQPAPPAPRMPRTSGPPSAQTLPTINPTPPPQQQPAPTTPNKPATPPRERQ